MMGVFRPSFFLSRGPALHRADLGTWYAETLRFTAFALLMPESQALDWWRDLTGEPPEIEVQKKRIGVYQAVGDYGTGKLVLDVTGNKIDWTLVPVDDPARWPDESPSPSIGSFLQAIDVFTKLMHAWLKYCPPASRIAFGSRLLLPAVDKEHSYRQISAYLPFRLDEKGSSDFLYQINRPRKSTVMKERMTLNRLSKWAAYRATLAGAIPGQSVFSTEPKHLCCLEIDINTNAEFPGPLPSGEIPDLFRELVELGTEIVKMGDVP